MGSAVITVAADNIISPLGMTSEANLQAVLDGRTELKLHEDVFGLPEPFFGSLLDRDRISMLFERHAITSDKYTFFEKLCILSATQAIAEARLEAENEDVIFVISTTKGNVNLLENNLEDPECFIGESAHKIASYFGNRNTPIVASNACISGVCAQIAAVRALLGRRYRHAVVIGCDVLSKFIVSGFQSFKALSSGRCRPFDKERVGLNLGEAAATMILTAAEAAEDRWVYAACSNHNDANHISGPSRTGEGSFRVLNDLLAKTGTDNLAFVSLHGTATPYNDEMESIAMHRAGLSQTPACGLKGFYGHTLGSAGIIETILSMKSLDNGLIPPTAGFATQGTTYPVNVADTPRPTDKSTFIKILSGFGGSNAGIAYKKGGEA